MKLKQISSIDSHYLVKELQVLKDSRVDKIYQPEKNIIIFSFYKTNVGKKILKIIIGQAFFLVEDKEAYETLGFGMFLRKYIDNNFIYNISQIEPERILKLSFKVKDSAKHLYIEFFGKGNAILCDENDTIINSFEQHEFKDRTIKPKVRYKHPLMKYNIFDLNKNNLADLFKNSKKDTLITCLAIELGLGGVYSEEVCLLSNINKNTNPKNIDEKQAESISNLIKKLISKKTDSKVFYEDNTAIDVTPFDLEFYKENYKKQFTTFSEAVSFFYSQTKEDKGTEFDKSLKNLQRVMEEQKKATSNLKEEEKELREKGELIYHKYNIIKEILDEINKASKKYSWREIKEKLKEHTIIKDVNENERKIVIEL